MHLYSCSFHIPLGWQNSSSVVFSCPFDAKYVGLHNGIVPGDKISREPSLECTTASTVHKTHEFSVLCQNIKC